MQDPGQENAFTCSSSKSFSKGGIDDGDFVHHSQELISTPVEKGMSHYQLCQHAPGKLPDTSRETKQHQPGLWHPSF